MASDANDCPITQVRIDVPLKSDGLFAYLFLEPAWSSWWAELLELLVRLAPQRMKWEPHYGGGCYALVRLDEAQCEELLAFLQAAPQAELDGHKTLRRAASLTR